MLLLRMVELKTDVKVEEFMNDSDCEGNGSLQCIQGTLTNCTPTDLLCAR